MASITTIANEFFVACETGKGWEGCKAFCAPNATFAAQAIRLMLASVLQRVGVALVPGTNVSRKVQGASRSGQSAGCRCACSGAGRTWDTSPLPWEFPGEKWSCWSGSNK